MKKILGISLVAVLAATPLMAKAAAVAGTPTHEDSPVLAVNPTTSQTINPGYALAEANPETDVNAASAGYVKGAYNAAIKAINTVNSNLTTAIGNVESANATTAGEGLKKTNGKFSVDLTEHGGLQTAGEDDTATLEVVVDGTTIEKNSSTGALQVKANTYDAYGDAAAVETKLTAGANGYDIDAKTLQVQDVDVVTVSGSQTLTNKGINADNNSISELETDNFKSGVIQTTVRASTNASDTAIASEKAVATAIEGAVTDLGMSAYAKKTGVVKTIQDTTIDTSVGQFTLTSGTVTGTASVAIMDDWSNPNTPASTPLSVTHNLAVATDITEGAVTAAINDNSVVYAEPAAQQEEPSGE